MHSSSNPMSETLLAQDKKAKAIHSNRRTDLIVGAVETATIAGIFSTFLTEASRKFLEKIGRYPLFGGAGVLNVARTILAIRQAVLEDGKNGTKEKAVLEASSTVIVVPAVVGGFAEAPYAKFAPHMFTGMLASKAVFHAGAALYYRGKAAGSEDEADKEHYNELATINAIVGTSLSLSTLATGFVMILSQVEGFAEVGMAATIFSTGYQLYGAYNMKAPTSSLTIEEVEDENEDDLEAGNHDENGYVPPVPTVTNVVSPSSPAGIHRALGTTPTVSVASSAVVDSRTISVVHTPRSDSNVLSQASNDAASAMQQPETTRRLSNS
jgi:hypothetical protein